MSWIKMNQKMMKILNAEWGLEDDFSRNAFDDFIDDG